jgi:hypothetical protein
MRITNFTKIPQNPVAFNLCSPLFAIPQVEFEKDIAQTSYKYFTNCKCMQFKNACTRKERKNLIITKITRYTVFHHKDRILDHQSKK